jgi:hypothetical protein
VSTVSAAHMLFSMIPCIAGVLVNHLDGLFCEFYSRRFRQKPILFPKVLITRQGGVHPTGHWRCKDRLTMLVDSGVPAYYQRDKSQTVLPQAMAAVVSLVSRSTSVSIRVGTYVSELVLDSARASTLASFGVSRRLLEHILSRANDDTPETAHWASLTVSFSYMHVHILSSD